MNQVILLSSPHSPSLRLSFSSLCVSEIHTYSLAQRRESVTMETRRRDSKSYLLRRELRQQKGVHCVSGRKAATYTTSIHLPSIVCRLSCQLFYLHLPVLVFSKVCVCLHTNIHVYLNILSCICVLCASPCARS